MAPFKDLDVLGNDTPPDDEGPTTVELERQANQPASEAFVIGRIRHHDTYCWAKRLRLWLYFVAGGLLVGQVAAVYIVRASLATYRAETELLKAQVREQIRETVDQVLREKKILGQASAGPMFAATPMKEVPR